VAISASAAASVVEKSGTLGCPSSAKLVSSKSCAWPAAPLARAAQPGAVLSDHGREWDPAFGANDFADDRGDGLGGSGQHHAERVERGAAHAADRFGRAFLE